MEVQSFIIPQADRLTSVVQTIIAVAKGARTDREIIQNIHELNTDRQGRYYRNAAETLGFINNYRNNATLTEKGKEFLKNPVINNPIFITSVLNIEIIQRFLPYLELHKSGLSKNDIENYVESIVSKSIGPSMIPRRVMTILSWLKTLNVVQEKNALYFSNNEFTSNLPVFELTEINQPLLPATGDLYEYTLVSERTSKAKEMVEIYKDQAKLERSNKAHIQLVNIVATRISATGAVPKSNKLIDLAVALDDDYIFEMKSTNNDNARSQIRKGLSQLYEYRYLQNKRNAILVLVIENPLAYNVKWMIDYLENDRDIHLVWDGNNQLYGTDATRNALRFLNLQSM